MSKKPLPLALLSLLDVDAGPGGWPPGRPVGRMVQDAVPCAAAEVKRLKKEIARDKSLAEELDVARARLATAQGKMGEARAAWQRIIGAGEERMAPVGRPLLQRVRLRLVGHRALRWGRCGGPNVARPRSRATRPPWRWNCRRSSTTGRRNWPICEGSRRPRHLTRRSRAGRESAPGRSFASSGGSSTP